MGDKTRIKVTLKGSVHGQLRAIRASVHGLGLRRIRDTKTMADTREIRGLIEAARHLLVVERA